jgi:hypothetical protein
MKIGLPKANLKLALTVALGVAAFLCWWQADAFWAWRAARQLASADDAHRDGCIQKVVALDAAAVPRLLDHLAEAEEGRCRNVGLALAVLAQNWGAEDPRGSRLLTELTQRFPGYSIAGQKETLRVTAALLTSKGANAMLPAHLTQQVGTLLTAAEKKEDLRQPLLMLAGALLERVPTGQWRDWSRKLALAGLTDPTPETRLAAVQMMLHEPFKKDADLLGRLVLFLKDESVSVRKACVLALSSAREVLGDDDLLPLLHDADLEVQILCEQALRSRGLTDEQIELARLISNPRPEVRLQVLHYLQGDRDVEPGVWLRRLSQDIAPAVRAAAARAASRQTSVDLRDRLRDMALQDPSPTVRQLAGHYFERHQQLLQDSARDD